MKKEYIIGGLALLGVIGVISYLRKPKRNSDGFFGATGGRTVGSTSRGRKKRCRGITPDGKTYYYATTNGHCDRLGGGTGVLVD
jgi:hypothetical protein